MPSKDRAIFNVYPEIEGGKFLVKREEDRALTVSCSTLISGKPALFLKSRKKGERVWSKKAMHLNSSGKWEASVLFPDPGRYEYTIEAESSDGKTKSLQYGKILEVAVRPARARFAAWYEMFHRSQGKIPGQSATFRDMEGRLDDIERMGFDVIYLPPVHPIGVTKRKGPDNSLYAGPNDPGCPWAIGNHFGGHKAVNPELGTLEEFRKFIRSCKKRGMDVAIDLAFNCSPDHPYLKEHPEWFFKRADGTIAYAENPPKKYEDIYPLNFFPENKDAMWQEMKSIFTFWCKQGITTFRVDNPHTKPADFWEWLIREVKAEYPEAMFLAEAFTAYDKLEYLAKVGYDQSYTYFTWRNQKNELIEYFLKLTGSYLKEFLFGNLFVNTPDICPPVLQNGGRPAFKLRIALAATLSSVYGMYNGYELCEAGAYPGTEIYKDSEKYQYKVWDWDRPGNIKDYIGSLNRIRRENPALQQYDNLRIYNSTNDSILFYGKATIDKENVILVAVNLDPFNSQEARVTVPVEELGLSSDEEYQVDELISGRSYSWRGRENYLRIEPWVEPVYIFKVRKI
ncbi:MAG: DUF3416 domain-containing protein [Candidatus Wallbacteria bacterium]|nr:DUF3416 domain-containing protein [Candidatus Wallbacteria bacterium]